MYTYYSSTFMIRNTIIIIIIIIIIVYIYNKPQQNKQNKANTRTLQVLRQADAAQHRSCITSLDCNREALQYIERRQTSLHQLSTGEASSRSAAFLLQRLSVAVQRGNAASELGRISLCMYIIIYSHAPTQKIAIIIIIYYYYNIIASHYNYTCTAYTVYTRHSTVFP